MVAAFLAIGLIAAGGAGALLITQEELGPAGPASADCQYGCNPPPPRTPTATDVQSSVNPSTNGQQVTYTATVTPNPFAGTVVFTEDGANIPGCSSVSLSSATASCTTSYATTGTHTIVAAFTGNSGFVESNSPNLLQVVAANPCPTLSGCSLKDVDLSGADLSNASLSGSNFKNTKLVGANLSGADLTNANLADANLTNANLQGANLTGANLKGANLTGANLAGAVTAGAGFNKVIWSNTTCVDGTNSDGNGGTCAGHLA